MSFRALFGRKKIRVLLAALLVLLFAWNVYDVFRIAGGLSAEEFVRIKLSGQQTIEEALRAVSPQAEKRLRPHFQRADLAYPPKELTIIGLKKEKRIEVWAKQENRWVFVRSYTVLAASGSLGPKLKEGDRQVPEGVYKATHLNPNSQSYLSIRLGYPNAFEKSWATAEGRNNLGGDIMIHGENIVAKRAASIGCYAVDDRDMEELFTLVGRTGLANTKIISAPNDLRRGKPATDMNGTPGWLPDLYETLEEELRQYPVR